MIDINNYIQEKLHISKGFKVDNAKNMINNICKILEQCCMSHKYSYKIQYITEDKFITEEPEETWFISLNISNIEPHQSIKLYKEIKELLKDIVPEEYIKYIPIFERYEYHIYLYDPDETDK